MTENIPFKSAYFIGIGGVGLSAAAGIASSLNIAVTGSDSKEIYSPTKEILNSCNIKYFIGYNYDNVAGSLADVYVISSGETLENPEVKYVYEKNLKHMGLGEFLRILGEDKIRIVVTGTHGKSTTTGFLGTSLKALDDSSFFTGGALQKELLNFYSGKGNYFVFEGDEYKEEFDDPTPKFHFYQPDILVLTNLEYDHPDIFETFEDLEEEFRSLISKLPPDGLLVYNADNIHLTKLAFEAPCNTVSFGIIETADFKAEHIEYGLYTKIEVSNKFSKNQTAKLLGINEEYQIQLPGTINVYNALAAIATLRTLGFQPEQVGMEILAFKGIKRRFEVIAEKKGVTIIDDYAHHPTAVRETLAAARLKYFPENKKVGDPGKLWAIFEPHTFSRTKATLKELAASFGDADEVLISEIYPAREKIQEGNISSSEVINEIIQRNGENVSKVRLVENKESALKILKHELRPKDVVVVMAVGDFNKLAYELKEIL